MFMITAFKLISFAMLMVTIGLAAVATGVVFGCYLIAMARNPAENAALFSNAMIGFVLIESFVFTALAICAAVYFAL